MLGLKKTNTTAELIQTIGLFWYLRRRGKVCMSFLISAAFNLKVYAETNRLSQSQNKLIITQVALITLSLKCGLQYKLFSEATFNITANSCTFNMQNHYLPSFLLTLNKTSSILFFHLSPI